MKLILQIAAGIVVGSLVFWGGCALFLGAAIDEASRQQQKELADLQASWRRNAKPSTPVSFVGLQPGQLCLGWAKDKFGVVFVRSGEGQAASVSQLVENGRPVQCVGTERVK